MKNIKKNGRQCIKNRLNFSFFTFHSFTYTHDKVGNRLSKTETDKRYDYSYDAIYRLLQSAPLKINRHGKEDEQEHKAEVFTYDAVGNRLTGPKDRLGYTYNQGNQLTELTKIPLNKGGEGVVENEQEKKSDYTYDKNGNLTKKIEYDDDGNIKTITLYTYDFENRLIRVEIQKDGREKIVEFTYDPFGRKLSKSVHREEFEDDNDGDDEDKEHPRATYYVYDNEDIILEYQLRTPNSELKTTRYVHGLGIDEPLAIEQKGKTYYYHADGLGSITALTDSKGKVVQRYDYDSFGKLKKHGDKVKNTFTYTAREWDKEIGLYYYRARYYDAKVGRFIGKDPFPGLLNLPQTLNLYTYVGNNPLKFIDPFGFSEAIFNPNTGMIVITDRNGNVLGQFPAGNNTAQNSNGPVLPGNYPIGNPVAINSNGDVNADGIPDGTQFGPYFIPIQNVPGRSGIGIHGGRSGPQSPTLGCIRTSNEDITTIVTIHNQDPITNIIVQPRR